MIDGRGLIIQGLHIPGDITAQTSAGQCEPFHLFDVSSAGFAVAILINSIGFLELYPDMVLAYFKGVDPGVAA